MCLGISMTIVTGCYVLVNVAYIAVLGKDGILASPAVALVSLHFPYNIEYKLLY